MSSPVVLRASAQSETHCYSIYRLTKGRAFNNEPTHPADLAPE